MIKAFEIGHERALLTAVTRSPRDPGPGDALVRVRATSINARDITYARFGGDPARRGIIVPLSDNAGDVLAVGPGVDEIAPGDRVIGCHYALWRDGAWDPTMSRIDIGRTRDGYLAERAIVPAGCLVRIPDTLDYEEACTLPVAGLTAWRALVDAGRPKPGDVVLTLGAGGVSVFGVQIAKMMGARVIVTSSDPAKLEQLRAVGADVAIDSTATPDWPAAVKAASDGRGADVVLNTIGHAAVAPALASCAPHARMIQIGGARADVEVKTLNPTIPWNLSTIGISNGSRRMLADLVRAVDANGLKPLIDRRYAFDEAPAMYDAMQARAHVGKLVLRVD